VFPDIYAKTENGFVKQGNCFVGAGGRNIGAKNPMNSAERPALMAGWHTRDFRAGRHVFNGLRLIKAP
jgi:hypothetical protein